MARILSIDYGRKRTGLAVTDPLQLIAGALATVPTHTLFDFLTTYLSRESVERIVVGHPTRLDGTPSDTMTQIRPLVARLQRTFPNVPVVLYDERFTSTLAHRAMIDGGLKRNQRRQKERVDSIAATILLNDYLAAAHHTDTLYDI